MNMHALLSGSLESKPSVFQMGAHTSVLPVSPGPTPGNRPKPGASTIVLFGSGSSMTRKGWWLAGQLGQCMLE